ncbi:MAG: hypothetical protein EG826_10240 [Deltaproteobacteria bacterium]|nr:hypothetical protein [Deltaproteobacteria bacterium]
MVAQLRGKRKNPGFLASLPAGFMCMIALAILLTSCGGDNEGYSYTIRGTVTGMVGGGLVLQNNGVDDLIVPLNGTFVFGRAIPTGLTYSVTIKTLPPAISQTCVVVNGAGTVNDAPVNNIIINCLAPPSRLVVTPPGTFAYAANYKTGNVSAFTINAGTGALVPVLGSPFAAGTNPNSATIDPSGNFLYVANLNSNSVSAYAIDAVTGVLTEVIGSPFAAGTAPYTLTIMPTTAVSPALAGRIAYVPNVRSNNISAYLINTLTGSLSELVGAGSPFAAGTNPSAITIDPTGNFAYVVNTGASTISTYVIDQTTGALVAGTTATTGVNPTPVAIATIPGPKAFAYITNTGQNTLFPFAIDPVTGNLTVGSQFTTSATPNALTLDPSGRFLYAANFDGNAISTFIVDQLTGGLLAGAAVFAGSNPYAFSIIPNTATTVALRGKYAYAANYTSNNTSAYSIDTIIPPGTGTGTLTQITGSPFAAGTNPYAFTIDPLGRFAYTLNAGSSNISVYAIDQTNGALTPGTAVPLP